MIRLHESEFKGTICEVLATLRSDVTRSPALPDLTRPDDAPPLSRFKTTTDHRAASASVRRACTIELSIVADRRSLNFEGRQGLSYVRGLQSVKRGQLIDRSRRPKTDMAHILPDIRITPSRRLDSVVFNRKPNTFRTVVVSWKLQTGKLQRPVHIDRQSSCCVVSGGVNWL